MPRCRKEGNHPQKLTSFFHTGPKQNGASSSSTPTSGSTKHSAQKGTTQKRCSPPKSPQSSLARSNSGSSEKARFRMDAADADHEVSSLHNSGNDSRKLPDSIDLFPTKNQPVIDTVLKEMLVSLRSSLHSDMISCVHKFSTEVQSVSARMTHIETKMGEYANTTDDLVDANESKEDDLEVIKAKMADTGDTSRSHKVKIRGVLEFVQQQDLRNYVSQLFNTVMPDMSALVRTVDRIHRLPKPTYFSDNIPRNVILRFHFYHAK